MFQERTRKTVEDKDPLLHQLDHMKATDEEEDDEDAGEEGDEQAWGGLELDDEEEEDGALRPGLMDPFSVHREHTGDETRGERLSSSPLRPTQGGEELDGPGALPGERPSSASSSVSSTSPSGGFVPVHMPHSRHASRTDTPPPSPRQPEAQQQSHGRNHSHHRSPFRHAHGEGGDSTRNHSPMAEARNKVNATQGALADTMKDLRNLVRAWHPLSCTNT